MSIVYDYRVPQKPAEPFPEDWEPAAIFQAIDRSRRKPEPVEYIDMETYSPIPREWIRHRKAEPVTIIDIETRLMGKGRWEDVLAIAVKEGDDPVKIIKFNS